MSSALTARLRRALPRPNRRALLAWGAVVVLVASLVGWAVWPERRSFRTEDAVLTVATGPHGLETVRLDTRFYLPNDASAENPVPAVLLGHGFGGSKESVREDAERLADLGYAVLTWSAQGFGASTGQIHLNDSDYEVSDARRLLDWLGHRPEVVQDAAGDPRAGVVGGSYGGALALLLAGEDPRVDAVVPLITWNSLARSLLPEATGRPSTDGVFKKAWAGVFFGNAGLGGVGGVGGADAPGTAGEVGEPGPDPNAVPDAPDPGAGASGVDPACGRFARDVCATYLRIATTGRADAAAVALLERSSPERVLSRITAPTLLIQGTADSLFPISEVDANARGIAATGTPVRVAWFTGGHDGGAGPETDTDRLDRLMAQWLGHYLKRDGSVPAPSTSFTYSRVAGFNPFGRGLVTNGYVLDAYPGTGGTGSTTVTVAGPPQRIANPPAGNPAAMTSLPVGAGGLASFLDGFAMEVPGQHARFVSEPLATRTRLAGAATVTLRAASPTGEAVLFVKLYDVGPDGDPGLATRLVAPVRLTGLPADIAQARPVTVTLPVAVHEFEAGHRLGITVATADQAYATPVEPTVYTVALGDGLAAPVTVPTLGGDPIATPALLWRWVLAGLLVAIAVGLVAALVVARMRHRRADRTVSAEHADTPLVVRGLRKAYADGFVAVSRVDFTVERGQVVGLLGPNGAGKTTSLRVLMGLTRPTAGEVLVFGHRLTPGSPVLSRLGALVEGPGFLPHLSGRANLESFWRATGRSLADARLDEALEIAGLGDAIDRRVRTYSHGMRQRLAIAQAMLGLPELLVLDEPTDGLDPPQIAEMRRVLRRYATDGRAVLVSSHLLAEVEQTCTHVVVVHKGEVVASGPVDDIVGDSPTVLIDVTDPEAARAALADLAGVRTVGSDGNGGLVVDIDGTARSEVVARLVGAGVGVDRVTPRRRLEDAFLALVGEHSRGSGDR